MPFKHTNTDCLPLVIDNEYEIENEDLLAEYVAMIILGHFSHVKRIIKALATQPLEHLNDEIDQAIEKLKSEGKEDKQIEKRDGWIFQMISWLALFSEYKDATFYCQQPHDAPAQHGLDGVAITLDDESKIKNIIITEDKCTTNPRVVIPKVWSEFEEFEKGLHNNKLVSRVSALIETLDNGDILETNRNDIYNNNLRKYRLGINRNDSHQEVPRKRIKLFKGYDGCVKGEDPHRRYGATLYQPEIRLWMDDFCNKIIIYLNGKKKLD